MEINADFTQRVIADGQVMPWQASPITGVSRKMLDRIGDEAARATSLVRYDPNSQFSPHIHGGGEEFIVLDGVFQDEHGDYPAGSYVRNPPQSRHTPHPTAGCVIFVKLWQFNADDRTHVRMDINGRDAIPALDRQGVSVIPLYQDAFEEVRVEIWQPGIKATLDASGGAELFVLEGSLEESGDHLRKQLWLRIPKRGQITATAGASGAQVWIKTGHLRYVVASN